MWKELVALHDAYAAYQKQEHNARYGEPSYAEELSAFLAKMDEGVSKMEHAIQTLDSMSHDTSFFPETPIRCGPETLTPGQLFGSGGLFILATLGCFDPKKE